MTRRSKVSRPSNRPNSRESGTQESLSGLLDSAASPTACADDSAGISAASPDIDFQAMLSEFGEVAPDDTPPRGTIPEPDTESPWIETNESLSRVVRESISHHATESVRREAGFPTSAKVSVSDSGLEVLSEQLRQEIRDSVAELQALQTAQAAAQSEVLRTLTEMIFQSSGSFDLTPEVMERAFSGIEARLMAKLDTVSVSATAVSPKVAEERSGTPAVKLQRAASTVARSWEQIRSELMAKGEITETPAITEQKPSVQLPEMTQLTSDRHFRLPEQDPSLEIPKCVDPETATHEELRKAFQEREAFISTLIARIRRQQELATSQLSQEQLRGLAADLPEELASQVRYTLKQMDDLARMSELELSLERARIARQVNQLQHSRQIIEHNARQLGMQLNEDGAIVSMNSSGSRTSQNRRWLGKLGFGQ